MCQVGPVKPTEEWSHTRLRPPGCAALQPLCAPGLTPAEQPLLSSTRALLLATAALTARRRPQDPRSYQWSRRASPPVAQPLVVPPWCATGRRGSSEAAALHAPAAGGAAFSRSLCSGFPAFIGGHRYCCCQLSRRRRRAAHCFFFLEIFVRKFKRGNQRVLVQNWVKNVGINKCSLS